MTGPRDAELRVPIWMVACFGTALLCQAILSVVRHLSAPSYIQFRSVQDDELRGPPP